MTTHIAHIDRPPSAHNASTSATFEPEVRFGTAAAGAGSGAIVPVGCVGRFAAAATAGVGAAGCSAAGTGVAPASTCCASLPTTSPVSVAASGASESTRLSASTSSVSASSADAVRCPGSRCMKCTITASTCAGTVASALRGGCNGSISCLTSIACGVGASNGKRPVTSS